MHAQYIHTQIHTLQCRALAEQKPLDWLPVQTPYQSVAMVTLLSSPVYPFPPSFLLSLSVLERWSASLVVCTEHETGPVFLSCNLFLFTIGNRFALSPTTMTVCRCMSKWLAANLTATAIMLLNLYSGNCDLTVNTVNEHDILSKRSCKSEWRRWYYLVFSWSIWWGECTHLYVGVHIVDQVFFMALGKDVN